MSEWGGTCLYYHHRLLCSVERYGKTRGKIRDCISWVPHGVSTAARREGGGGRKQIQPASCMIHDDALHCLPNAIQSEIFERSAWPPVKFSQILHPQASARLQKNSVGKAVEC